MPRSEHIFVRTCLHFGSFFKLAEGVHSNEHSDTHVVEILTNVQTGFRGASVNRLCENGTIYDYKINEYSKILKIVFSLIFKRSKDYLTFNTTPVTSTSCESILQTLIMAIVSLSNKYINQFSLSNHRPIHNFRSILQLPDEIYY